MCPHSTYLLSEDQLRAVGELAAESGAGVHVHACETNAELAQVARRHGGRTPIEVLRDTGLLGPRTVLAHGVHLTDADIALIAEANASVAHCPASNLKLASGFARITDLLAADVTVSLGTDGAASANDLDPFLAMRLAAYPQSALHGAGALNAARSGGDGDDQRGHRARHRRPYRVDRVRQAGRPRRPRRRVPGVDTELRPGVDARLRGVACRRPMGRRRRACRRRRPAS